MKLLAQLLAVTAVFVIPVAGCVSDNPVIVPDGGFPDAAAGKPNGDLCSTGGECTSGFCADGVCCNTACSGQCEACSVGTSKGTCTPVTGTPIAPRAACTGAGSLCGGTCDGKSSNCTFPSAGTICGGSCTGTCDGAGTCSDPGTGTCPNGYACGSGKCLTSCTGPSDCQPNFTCDTNTSTCQRVPESNCLDGIDNNGDGLADCADPTCVDVNTGTVECVPSVGGGQTLGTVVTTTTCPTGFGSAQPIYQTPNAGSCTGCSCKTECAYTLTLYTDSACGSYYTSLTSYLTNGVNSTCDNITDHAIGSAKMSYVAPYSCVGSGTATWNPSTPAWQTTKYFCPIGNSSATCTSGQVCVPKGSISVKIPGGSTCPTGYNTPATYYASYSNGSCPACSVCNKDNAYNCGVTSFGYTASQACSGSNDLVSGNTSNYNSSCTPWYGDTIQSMQIDMFNLTGDNCSNNTTPTGPTPTSPQLVCNVQ